MERIRSVLVGVASDADGTLRPGSEAALETARFLLGGGARAHVLRVATGKQTPPGPALRARLGAVLPGAVVHDVASDRSLLDVFLTTAEQVGADMVIVGQHEGPRAPRRLGSLPRQLIHGAPLPVWAAHPDGPVRLERVLAATDLAPAGSEAVAWGARLAAGSGAELSVLHAHQRSMEEQLTEARLSPEEAAQRRGMVVRDVRERVRPYFGNVEDIDRVEVQVAWDAPERAIRKAIAAGRADVLVLGAVRRTGLSALILGSTAERLVDELPCAILAVKPPEAGS